MLQIDEQENSVSIRDLPLYGWTAGIAALVVGGVLTYTLIQMALNSRTEPEFSWLDARLWLFFVIPAIPIAFGVWYLCSRPITTTIVDRAKGKLVIIRKRFFSSSSDCFDFDDVLDVTVRAVSSYRNSTVYTPEIGTRFGGTFELMDFGFSRRGRAYDVVDLINKYKTPKSNDTDFKLTIINDD